MTNTHERTVTRPNGETVRCWEQNEQGTWVWVWCSDCGRAMCQGCGNCVRFCECQERN